MKNVILATASLCLIGAAASATSPGVKIDSSVQFSAANANCANDTLIVMRQWRAQPALAISHDLCLTLKASKDGWNIIGLTPDLKVRAIGFTENGAEIIATSDQMK